MANHFELDQIKFTLFNSTNWGLLHDDVLLDATDPRTKKLTFRVKTSGGDFTDVSMALEKVSVSAVDENDKAVKVPFYKATFEAHVPVIAYTDDTLADMRWSATVKSTATHFYPVGMEASDIRAATTTVLKQLFYGGADSGTAATDITTYLAAGIPYAFK